MQLTSYSVNKFILPGLLITALMAAHTAFADGVVAELSGTISAKRDDGRLILSRGSKVQEGDVVTTEKDSYAQIRFSDGAVMTLKPGTSIAIKEHRFSEQEPEKDSSTFSLLKGGLRTVSGLIGKRGNRDAYKMNTATATIGIRGTVFDVDDCATTSCIKDREAAADNKNNGSSKKAGGEEVLAPAVYVGVRDGEVVVKNDAGELVLSAGQFGIAPATNVLPAILPGNPGLSQISSVATESTVRGEGFEIRNCK